MQNIAGESETIDFVFFPWHNQAIESKRVYNLSESSARDVGNGSITANILSTNSFYKNIKGELYYG